MKPSDFQKLMAVLYNETPAAMALAYRLVREAFGGIKSRGINSSGVDSKFASKFIIGYLGTDRATYIAEGVKYFGSLPVVRVASRACGDDNSSMMKDVGLFEPHTLEQALSALLDRLIADPSSQSFSIMNYVNRRQVVITFDGGGEAVYMDAEEHESFLEWARVAPSKTSQENIAAWAQLRKHEKSKLINMSSAVQTHRYLAPDFFRVVARGLAEGLKQR